MKFGDVLRRDDGVTVMVISQVAAGQPDFMVDEGLEVFAGEWVGFGLDQGSFIATTSSESKWWTPGGTVHINDGFIRDAEELA